MNKYKLNFILDVLICLAIVIVLFAISSISINDKQNKVINSTRSIVKVTIKDSFHKDKSYKFIGGRCLSIADEENCIIVEYDGMKFTIDDYDTYKKFHNMIGEEVDAVLLASAPSYYKDSCIIEYSITELID